MPPVSETELELMPMQEGSGKLTRADCLCPICLEILLEPVTLPCAHTFCKPCFLETVDKANMCCPLCRKRVSTWARLNSKKKTLVNAELWKRIQDAFPKQCQRRENGEEEEEDMGTLIPKPIVCQPGELRREYEDQISKLVEEKQALEEAERKASEEYIQQLLAEEEERVAEERKRQEKWQLEEDERLARMLNQELNSASALDSQTNVKLNDAASTKKKKPNVGQIDKFLCPVPCRQPHAETSPPSSLLANKENILNSTTTFGPFSVKHTSNEIPVLDYCNKPSTSNSEPALLSSTATKTDSKRKSVDNEVADEGDVCKRICRSPWCESPLGESLKQELALQEEAIRSRVLQEEEDRRLAQKLQKELNREIAVDRRKGSKDSYLLRKKSSTSTSTSPVEKNKNAIDGLRPKEDGLKVVKRTSITSGEHEGKTPKRSSVSMQGSPSSASKAQKGSKQTTLTEMFNMSC